MKLRFFMKGKKHLYGKPHIYTPDTDNLIKAVKDALQGFFYHNDSQIFEVHATKVYGSPGISVDIEELAA